MRLSAGRTAPPGWLGRGVGIPDTRPILRGIDGRGGRRAAVGGIGGARGSEVRSLTLTGRPPSRSGVRHGPGGRFAVKVMLAIVLLPAAHSNPKASSMLPGNQLGLSGRKLGCEMAQCGAVRGTGGWQGDPLLRDARLECGRPLHRHHRGAGRTSGPRSGALMPRRRGDAPSESSRRGSTGSAAAVRLLPERHDDCGDLPA